MKKTLITGGTGMVGGQVLKQLLQQEEISKIISISRREIPVITWMLFAKTKGRAENIMNASGFPKKYIFRPGYIKPTGKKNRRMVG